MIRRDDWHIISGDLNLQQCLCKNRVPFASLIEGAHTNSLQTSIREEEYVHIYIYIAERGLITFEFRRSNGNFKNYGEVIRARKINEN